MLRPFSALSVLLFVVCALAPLHAQEVGVSIPAWIENKDCATAPEFEATIDGKPVPISAQLGPSSQQVILVVSDLTGDLSLIAAAKQAMIAEISKLPRNVWVGLLRDQDALRVLADPSPNRQPLVDAIQSVTNSGEPGLLDTVDGALSLANALIRKSPVRVAVLYITDGSIYAYREDYTNPVINASDPHDLSRRFPQALIEEKISKLKEDVSSLQAPLFVVHLHYRDDQLNKAYQNGLGSLAESTGGESDFCRSITEIPEVISTMFTRISEAWRLTLEVPARSRDNIRVRLSGRCGDGDLRLSWRMHLQTKGE